MLDKKWDDESFRQYRDAFPEDACTCPAALEAHVRDLTKRNVKIAYLKELQGYLWDDGYRSGAYTTPLFPDVGPQLKKWREDGINLAIYSSGSIVAQKLLFEHVKSHAQGQGQAGKKRTATEAVDAPAQVSGPSMKRSKVDDNPETSQQTKGKGKAHEYSDDASPVQTEDLRNLITPGGWFDTTNAGAKTQSSSYNKILATLKVSLSCLSYNLHTLFTLT